MATTKTITFLIMLARVTAAAEPAPPPLLPPRTPLTAATLAREDLKGLETAVRWQRRYVWLPAGGTKAELIKLVAFQNIAAGRVGNTIVPKLVAGGALAAVDFQELGRDTKETAALLRIWQEQGYQSGEPTFTVHLDKEFLAEPAPAGKAIKTADGKDKWQGPDGKVVEMPTPKTTKKNVAVISPNLGEVGPELESLIGNPAPTVSSYLPIVEIDWLISRALTSKDESKGFGFYYKWRGLETGKTTLEGYLKSRGADLKANEDAEDRVAFRSEVTMTGRDVFFRNAAGAKFSAGPVPIAVTNDNFENETDARKDPLKSLLDHKADGHEVFAPLSNGFIEYTLFNGQGVLVDEAPANLVIDNTIPGQHSKRLCAAISCIRCHAPSDGWMPFRNEVALILGDRGRLLSDLSGKSGVEKQFENFQRIQDLYSADLSGPLQAARDATDKRIFAVMRRLGLKVGAREFFSTIGDQYNGYEYEPITPLVAVKALGFLPPEQDPTGIGTFRTVVPPLDPNGLLQDDASLIKLRTAYTDELTGESRTLTLTRRQWELVYQDALRRSQPILDKMDRDAAGWLVAKKPPAPPAPKPKPVVTLEPNG